MLEICKWIIFVLLEVATVSNAQSACLIAIEESTVTTMSCLTVGVTGACSSSTYSVLYERGTSGDCSTLTEFNTIVTELTFSNFSVCLATGTNVVEDFCYRVSLLCKGNPIATSTNINAAPCSVSALKEFLNERVSYALDSSESNGKVVHLTRATLSCNSATQMLDGSSETKCVRGEWISSSVRSCAYSNWIIAVIIIIDLVLLVVVVVQSVVIWLSYRKRKRPSDDPVYEIPDVDEIIPNPRTEVNIAYECIPNTRGEIPKENITSLPNTQENVVYEQVELY